MSTPKVTEPSFTVSHKWLAFFAALYLGYKEVRDWISKNTEAEVQFAYVRKDVESIKTAQESIKSRMTDLLTLKADFEAERSRSYSEQQGLAKDIAELKNSVKTLTVTPTATKPAPQ